MILNFFTFFTIFVTALLIIYKLHDVEITKRSIFSWCIIYIELYLFLWGFTVLFNLKEPIYIENISQYSLLRYAIFVSLTLIFGIFYYIFKSSKPTEIGKILSIMSYPYVKEEVTNLLNHIYSTKLYNKANAILYNIRNKYYCKIIYLLFTFFTYHAIRIIHLTFFIYFVFFHGDFFLLIAMLPFTMLSWFFNYLLFWFEAYVRINTSKGAEIVTANTQKVQENFNIVRITEDDLKLSLTPYGKSLGYEDTQLPILTVQWLALFHTSYLINYYKRKTQRLDKILLSIRICCWIYLSFLLFTNV
jgi:hypothetical protein